MQTDYIVHSELNPSLVNTVHLTIKKGEERFAPWVITWMRLAREVWADTDYEGDDEFCDDLVSIAARTDAPEEEIIEEIRRRIISRVEERNLWQLRGPGC